MAIQLQYLEKDIEDLLEKNCEHYLGLQFIKRQFRTSVGIVDVIAKHPDSSWKMPVYFVIEIKQKSLDSSSYTQVLRYTKWLNSEKSKGGKRLFLPLLIGRFLDRELRTICEYFDPGIHCGMDDINRMTYRIFNFDPHKGITFEWCDPHQEAHFSSLISNNNHIFSHRESFEVGYFDMQDQLFYTLRQLKKYESDYVDLTLVEKSSGAA